MTAERWERITEVFEAAADLTAGSRKLYLDRACGDDTDLRRQVEAMLANDTADTALERSVRRAAVALDPIDLVPGGGRIGPWMVLEALGSGGMGTVFRVVRADGSFQMEAALKLLHASSREMRLRFRQERQILARLEHPGIARLVDGGETMSGQSYLVLEYVRGVNLLEFADAHRLGRDQRLRLFLRVFEAVQYLHRNLIIHRDLKPGNILVGADGNPKLLDFGIAKLLDEDATRTRSGVFALTPQYASPEQVRGLPVATTSDVYSLGAILYELLSGRRPYEVRSISPVEVDRMVWESEIPRPELGDDLDNILLMALRREPERRYQSVEQFAADIERAMSHQPVAARPDTFAYRAAKYVRRNRIPIAAAVLVVASLTAGVVVSAREAARARQRFNQSRAYANAILKDFYPKIELVVGSTEARKFLVETTARHLNDLAADASGDPELALDLANGFRLIGSVQGGERRVRHGESGGGHPEPRPRGGVGGVRPSRGSGSEARAGGPGIRPHRAGRGTLGGRPRRPGASPLWPCRRRRPRTPRSGAALVVDGPRRRVADGGRRDRARDPDVRPVPGNGPFAADHIVAPEGPRPARSGPIRGGEAAVA
jgi:predicted Ser/Thr protein kinase